MKILETTRLLLRELTPDDAAFIFELLNDPTWLQFIGDRGIRTLDDARAYIANGPVASYARHGFGLWLVERRADGVATGICGLLKRETLESVDIGFAFLQKYQGLGYASECATATMAHGRDVLGLKRIVAVTSPGNAGSIHVLEKLGMRYERMVRLAPASPEIMLFA